MYSSKFSLESNFHVPMYMLDIAVNFAGQSKFQTNTFAERKPPNETTEINIPVPVLQFSVARYLTLEL